MPTVQQGKSPGLLLEGSNIRDNIVRGFRVNARDTLHLAGSFEEVLLQLLITLGLNFFDPRGRIFTFSVLATLSFASPAAP